VVADTMPLFNSMVSPWHPWIDPVVYRGDVDQIGALGATTIASAHGPVLTAGHLHQAFDTVRASPAPRSCPAPGRRRSTRSSLLPSLHDRRGRLLHPSLRHFDAGDWSTLRLPASSGIPSVGCGVVRS
jgi:hypothetical protein